MQAENTRKPDKCFVLVMTLLIVCFLLSGCENEPLPVAPETNLEPSVAAVLLRGPVRTPEIGEAQLAVLNKAQEVFLEQSIPTRAYWTPEEYSSERYENTRFLLGPASDEAAAGWAKSQDDVLREPEELMVTAYNKGANLNQDDTLIRMGAPAEHEAEVIVEYIGGMPYRLVFVHLEGDAWAEQQVRTILAKRPTVNAFVYTYEWIIRNNQMPGLGPEDPWQVTPENLASDVDQFLSTQALFDVGVGYYGVFLGFDWDADVFFGGINGSYEHILETTWFGSSRMDIDDEFVKLQGLETFLNHTTLICPHPDDSLIPEVFDIYNDVALDLEHVPHSSAWYMYDAYKLVQQFVDQPDFLDRYDHSEYESIWQMKDDFLTFSQDKTGVTGPLALDNNGDRSFSRHVLWSIRSGHWARVGSLEHGLDGETTLILK
jgi:hypothetical protein